MPSDERVAPPAIEPVREPASRLPPRGTLLIVFAILAALFTLTGVLASAFHSAEKARAAAHFEAGNQFAARGMNTDAIAEYRAAVALDHNRTQYKRALATTLFNSGSLKEAEARLAELVALDPSSGPINLMLARIAARGGDLSAAESYYHRSIYGLWPQGPQQHRQKTRFELVELLLRNHIKKRAEAELLTLADEVGEDAGTKQRIGELFLAADSPQNAAEILRGLIRQDSHNATLFSTLGTAEMRLANYRLARNALRTAVRLDPKDEAAAHQLQLVTDVLALDPTARGLSRRERHRRSLALLRRSSDDASRCAALLGEQIPAGLKEALDRAAKELESRQRAVDETVDANIALSEALFRLREEHCPNLADPDHAVALTIRRLPAEDAP
ncbi:MAG: hypothetical protein LC130_10240 [Bryobacterales bacterium]|nr:hypothetical protein [Bryobacterales bacterium]